MPELGLKTRSAPPPVGLVRVFAYYRFLLSILILGTHLAGIASGIFATFSPELFLTTAFAFVTLTTLGLAFLISSRFICESYLLFIYLLIDIVSLNVLMFASGGANSGIGLLLLVTIATGSLIFTGQLAIFLAAIASILMMAGTGISVVFYGADNATFFPTGLLGILLFLTGFLFRSLNRRLLDSQNLAIREADQAVHLQKLNEMIVNRMRTGIILVDTSAHIKLINNAAIEHLGGHKPGAPLAVGRPLKSLRELFEQYERWVAYPWLRCPPISIANTNSEIQCNFARLDEQEEQHTIIFIEDTRSTVQSAQQLKLASLGRLAGSIAHEVRNPLGAISHAAQMLAEEGEASTSIKQYTDIIGRQSERVNLIVDSILQLSRQKAPDFQKLHLGLWLNQFSHEYGNAHAGTETLIIDETDQNLQVLFDPVHLNQIITNLVENAHRYSKDETGEAWAKINHHIDQLTNLPCIDIYDKGPGVDEKHKGQIFEPFFTTSNAGSGLGLYLAKERCEFNYATLTYCVADNSFDKQADGMSPAGSENTDTNKGFFRVIFAHPDQLLPANN
jgi:two-component system, NtrC family, sensor histidine kinase PilS